MADEENQGSNETTTPHSPAVPDPAANLDDPDQVEQQQDNAMGHKSEVIDGPPGVPGGDPEDLADEADNSDDK